MPNHRNVYISLATSMSKTGKFQLTPLVDDQLRKAIDDGIRLKLPSQKVLSSLEGDTENECEYEKIIV